MDRDKLIAQVRELTAEVNTMLEMSDVDIQTTYGTHTPILLLNKLAGSCVQLMEKWNK